MKKLTFIISFVAVFVFDSFGQQLPQITQFMLNNYAINTAFAGKESAIEARILNRDQWTGITDAPRTFNLSVQGMTQNPKVGVGGIIFSDNAGPTRRMGLNLSYAYHLNLTDKWKLGLSVAGGALQFSIDGTRIDLDQADDPALFSEKRTQLVFDASFSALVYRENFYFGVTLPQLMQNNLDLYESIAEEGNKLEDHYYVTAGYKHELSDKWAVEPAILTKYVSPAPLKTDLSLRVIYESKVWLGGTYRTNDAIAMFAGYNYNDQISIGYAYDITTSSIKSFSDSTHELTLAFKVSK
ncbi:MAG: type IX secretion system membrane protein PorP/SprF [Flavobacteriales bacterium]